jgi:biopolymer transport protein ExbD
LNRTVFSIDEPEFQVAPMIDILLVLMTFFMSIVSAEIVPTRSLNDLRVPVAENSKPPGKGQKELTFNITYDASTQKGIIEWNQQILSDGAQDVQDLIRKTKLSESPKVRIRADEKVPYWVCEEVLRVCGEEKIDHIAFSVLAEDDSRTYETGR